MIHYHLPYQYLIKKCYKKCYKIYIAYFILFYIFGHMRKLKYYNKKNC